MSGVLIFAEVDRGELRPEFWELVTVATQLGAQGTLRVVMAGGQLGSASEMVRRSGAVEVIVMEDERLTDPWPEMHAEAISSVLGQVKPEFVLVPRTLLGMEVAARLASQLGWSLIQDATQIKTGPEGITAARPVFGGAVSATIKAAHGPWIVVPRPRAFAAAEPTEAASSPLVSQALAVFTPLTHCGVRTREESSGAIDIERARVLVAGGAGLGGPDPFRLLGEVAEILGGAVAASRVACDAGWVPTALQVGLTGKTVAPDLYMAVGISGAIHHLAGCSSAQVIVVVNNDRSAPFFRVANFGVVGDWKKVLPAFRDTLKAKLAVAVGAD